MRMYTWMLLQEQRLKRQAELTIIFVTKDNKVVTPKSDYYSSIHYETFSDVCRRALSWFGSRSSEKYIWMK